MCEGVCVCVCVCVSLCVCLSSVVRTVWDVSEVCVFEVSAVVGSLV